jgi:hypothetical protein
MINTIFLYPRASPNSWATWKNRWEDVDLKVKDFEEFKKPNELLEEFNKRYY